MRARAAMATASILVATAVAWAQPGDRGADWPARVLVTNDDGIDSPGLHALVRALAPVAEVTVVAPAGNRSGSASYAQVLSGRVVSEAREIEGARAAYAVAGFPADCVLIALTGLMADDPPDLVVSGINTAANLADAWAYSGTLGAARMATLQGVPSIAVSGGADDALDTVATWIAELVQGSIVRELVPPRYLAVDVPDVPRAELRGVVLRPRAQGYLTPRARPGRRGAADIPGQQAWVGRFDRSSDDVTGTDVEALDHGLVVITAMRASEADAAYLEELAGRSDELPPWPGGPR